MAVSGRNVDRTRHFAQAYKIRAIDDWRSLVSDDEIDLVVVATVSALHGEVVELALLAGKHVVVEYPLSLDVAQAQQLVNLAERKGLLLHVEHIELLGGLHRAVRESLADIGDVHYVNYRTLNPQNPAPRKWTYNRKLFGFAYCGALSRIQRMTSLFGQVGSVSCCTRYLNDEQDGWFGGVVSSARLVFETGVVAELTYGKGEGLWMRRRDIEVHGSTGAAFFSGNEGRLITDERSDVIAVAPRKGLFVKDTEAVLSYLTKGSPLYVSAAESVYALRVADALRRSSAREGEVVNMNN